jgi:tetratricopeptide (TPR) repeat protein
MAEDAKATEEPGGGDAVALGAAMAKSQSSSSPAVDRELTAYLAEQRHHLKSQFGLKQWEMRLGVLLRLATVFVGLAVAAGLAFMVWNAANDNGLVVEAFSVPPDLEARGLTGQVVAKQVLDDLVNLQAQSNSMRAQQSYSSNWGDDLKVAIPETGVSLSELNAWLHQMLGHQTRISGEIVHTATGLTVVARSGAESGKRFSGAETDLDTLLQQAAESVYGRTQAYRYGIILESRGKNQEAMAVYREMTHAPSLVEQGWGYGGLAENYLLFNQPQAAVAAARAAVKADPESLKGWSAMMDVDEHFGRPEEELAAIKTLQQLLNGPAAKSLTPIAAQEMQYQTIFYADNLLGDYADGWRQLATTTPSLDFSDSPAAQIQAIKSGSDYNDAAIGVRLASTRMWLSQHDPADAKWVLARQGAFMAVAPTGANDRNIVLWQFLVTDFLVALGQEDWTRADEIEAAMERANAKAALSFLDVYQQPYAAYALARAGDFAAAHAMADRLPHGHYLGQIAHAKIDAAEKNFGGADFWFAAAVKAAPSIPIAYYEWGKMLLARGDAAGAIAKFKLSNEKGPHFADALEGWGEALMAQNHADQAAAKFAEGETYAPNWGRLHLKWGEALAYAGRKDDTRKQFAIAASLDLAPSEKAELTARDTVPAGAAN